MSATLYQALRYPKRYCPYKISRYCSRYWQYDRHAILMILVVETIGRYR